MNKAIAALLRKLTDPAYSCVGVVVGLGPVVMPIPCGIIVGGIAGLAMVFGLVVLERMDGPELSDQQEQG